MNEKNFGKEHPRYLEINKSTELSLGKRCIQLICPGHSKKKNYDSDEEYKQGLKGGENVTIINPDGSRINLKSSQFKRGMSPKEKKKLRKILENEYKMPKDRAKRVVDSAVDDPEDNSRIMMPSSHGVRASQLLAELSDKRNGKFGRKS